MGEPDDVDEATNYHSSIEHLRRDLMLQHQVWQSQCRLIQDLGIKAEDMTNDQKIGFAASSMASNYAYSLAAVLGIAQKLAPPGFAQHLAFEVDEILTNGDFDDHNGDLAMDEPDEQQPEGA